MAFNPFGLGFTTQEIANFLGPAFNYDTALALERTLAGGPWPDDVAKLQALPPDALQGAIGGMQYLAEHPKGSKAHGFNPTDILANIGTGGLYGVGKSLLEGRPGSAAEQLGPFGSTTHPIPVVGPQIAQTGNLIGAGAGIGGGLSSGFQGGGFGAAPSGVTPFETAATQLGFSPEAIHEGSVALSGGPIFGGGVQYAPSFGPGSEGASGGLSGPGLGASVGQQLNKMLNPMGQPAPMMQPAQGGMLTGPQAQGLAPGTIAALGAQNDTPGKKSIDPAFLQRIQGKGNAPGLASQEDLSMAAIYGLGQGGR